MSTLRVNTLQNTSTTDGGISINNSGHVTVDGVAMPSAGPLSNRNKIINGDMRIDQRNAGASVTISNTSALTYTLDRWAAYGNVASKFSVEQDAGSVTAPAGFSNYLGVTSASAYSIAAADRFTVRQVIEGFNTSDLGFGTANAKTITVSFWVRSSLTGTFGGSVRNSAANRSYPFTYTISDASTWEQKSITIPGDTSGTWVGATNGTGLTLFFGLGVGSDRSGTAGAWAGSNYESATGATSVVGTNGATFYLTGVQLEVGSVATPFEHRSYSDELLRCQRYYFRSKSSTSAGYLSNFGSAVNASTARFATTLPVEMRADPTIDYSSVGVDKHTATYSITSLTVFTAPAKTIIGIQSGGSSGMTSGDPCVLYSSSTNTGYIEYMAEL